MRLKKDSVFVTATNLSPNDHMHAGSKKRCACKLRPYER